MRLFRENETVILDETYYIKDGFGEYIPFSVHTITYNQNNKVSYIELKCKKVTNYHNEKYNIAQPFLPIIEVSIELFPMMVFIKNILTTCDIIDQINSINVAISQLPRNTELPRLYPFYKDRKVIGIEVMALDIETWNYLHDKDNVSPELLKEISTIEKCQMVYGRKIAQTINRLFNEDGMLGVLTIGWQNCPTS